VRVVEYRSTVVAVALVTGRLLLHRSGGGGVDGGNRGEHSRGMFGGGGTKRGSIETARDRLAAGCCAGGGVLGRVA